MVQSIVDAANAVMNANGDMIYYNSGRQRLGKGDDGQFLKLASGLPSWAASGGLSSPLTSDLVYNDSVKAAFGTGGSDSYIMHDGSNMYTEVATGRLIYNTDASFAAAKCLALNLATVTISSGSITGSANVMNVNTEGASSSDDLEVADFTGAAQTGAFFGLVAGNSARTVVIKANATPNPKFLMSADFSLDNSSDFAYFSAVSGLTHNYGVATSNNAS